MTASTPLFALCCFGLVGCSKAQNMRVDLDANSLRIQGRMAAPLVTNRQDGFLDFPDSLYPPNRQNPNDHRVEPLRRYLANLDSPVVELRCAPDLRFVLVKPLLRAVAQSGVSEAKLCDLQGPCMEILLRDRSESATRFHDSILLVQVLEDSLVVGTGVAPIPDNPALREGALWQPVFLAGRRLGVSHNTDGQWADSLAGATRRRNRGIRLLILEPHPKVQVGKVLELARTLAKVGLPLAILGNSAP